MIKHKNPIPSTHKEWAKEIAEAYLDAKEDASAKSIAYAAERSGGGASNCRRYGRTSKDG